MKTQAEDTFARHKWRNGYVRGFVITLVSVCMTWALYMNWRNVPKQSIAVNPWWISISIVGVVATVFLQAVCWSAVMRLLGQKVRWGQGVRLWTLAQLTKYLPGGIWSWGARVYLSNREGMNARISALSVVMENINIILACLLIVGVLGLPTKWFAFLRWIVLLIALTAELAFVFWPHLLVTIILRLRSASSDTSFIVRRRDILAIVAIYLASMLFGGLVWFPFVRAFHSLSLNTVPGIVGSVVFAFVVGYLVVFVPQGWGIREGILGLLLAYYVSPPTAVVIAVFSRVWIIVGEVMAFGMVLFVCGFQRILERHRTWKYNSVTAKKT